MIKLCELYLKFLNFLINFMFVIQISLIILVFLTSLYWFCSLINLDWFDFAQPIADVISYLIKRLYQKDILFGGVYVDSSLIIFDVISVAIIFTMSKIKFHIYRAIDDVLFTIKKLNSKKENKFNQQLKKETDAMIKKCENAAVLVQFCVESVMPDWGENKNNKNKEDEAFTILYKALKNIQACKFAKTNNKMLILLSDFNKIDNVLHFVDLAIERIKINMKKNHYQLYSYISVDAYNNTVNFKEEIYPLMEKLLSLKQKNEILCYGNFCLRYELQKNSMYAKFLKGSYSFGSDVWALVKKSKV